MSSNAYNTNTLWRTKNKHLCGRSGEKLKFFTFKLMVNNMYQQSPNIITILPTYRCTAACKECCFESNPNLKSRLSRTDILEIIDTGCTSFPDLKMIVFSGGECFTLKSDLYAGIQAATLNGKMSRCVTNGYWGNTLSNARTIAEKLKDAGLSEINFSTGVDHQEHVPLSSVINAVQACAELGIWTMITIEKDTETSSCRETINTNPLILELLSNRKLMLQNNTWMPFKLDYVDRGVQIHQDDLMQGCEQIFNNLVVTPHGRISGCCGLTFEHIPEMKLGSIGDKDALRKAYDEQLNDFLKIWIKVDGPTSIIEQLMGSGYIENSIGTVSHNCQSCVYLHKKPEIVSALKENYEKYMSNVLIKYHASEFVSKKYSKDKLVMKEIR